ncbi:PKD domain-containing protein [Chitinophaga sp. GCM10012297]|uniref:T9SS type A sorting domain-containing protein n=1 Tax=Chitinophaga chungangae TaxID=2821488 RepID=A0ABS3YHV5_9BACT|nr:PKD domain-containing protein [Chitinophaga chungangae]MBO9154219.1 T9SS type A sorting domain-containing protein [Chitinophaga chungangae]
MKNTVIAVISILFPYATVSAQGSQEKITVNIAPGNTTGAWLHLPGDYGQTTTKYPLLIFLHGVGEGGTDVNKVLTHGVPKEIAAGANMEFTVGGKLFKFIVVSPQIPNGWASAGMVQSVLDDIKQRYRVDASRIYLTGLSAGGYGVLNYVASGKSYSDNLAAIVPVSTAAIDADKVAGLCNVAASNVPVWMLCGSSDGFLSNQEKYVAQINSCNPAVKPKGTTFAGGHDGAFWSKAYNTAHTYQPQNIYEWMLQYQRGNVDPDPEPTPQPPVVTFVSSSITIRLPTTTAVGDGSGSTVPGSTISKYAWAQVSGPTTATIQSPTAAKTNFSNLAEGTYKFSLTVTAANGLSTKGEVTVTVQPATAQPPVVAFAASSISIKLPTNTAAGDGSASTAPGSTINKYAWAQVSGPSGAAIESPAAAKTNFKNLAEGTYKFSLTVTDANGLSTKGEITVTVQAAAPAPGSGGSVACASCKLLIEPGADGGAYISGDGRGIGPGDTVCIKAGNYSYIQFFNFTGSADKPIVFINCGGQVKAGNGGNYGIIFNNVKYFKLTGSGSGDKYGFRVDGVTKKINTGVAMGKGCTDYEAERIEITGSEAGLMAKVNPDCDPANQYPNFAIRNVKLHDLYIHDVIGEGMYIGNTAPNGTPTDCNGTTVDLLPPRIYNLKIYNVITENTGWDGIQVASAPENVEIYNNSVYNYGTVNKGSQQAGIILGGESNGRVYNNKVIKGTGNAIEVFGVGLCYVYNNIVSEGGFDGTAEGQDAVFVDDRPTKYNNKPLQVYIFNNTVVNSARDAIRILNSKGTIGSGNLLYNNLVINAGSVAKYGDRGYINIEAGIDYTSEDNITGANINGFGFVNPGAKDFHIGAGSPAIDKGRDLSAYFTTDYDSDPRPMGAAFDVGADEYTAGAPVNKPPVARAGNDITITLPASTATLDGTGSDDPDGSISSYLWEQVSGPKTATIGNGSTNKAAITNMTVAGSYVFKLTVKDDKGVSASDQVTVTVNAAAAPPTANAGQDVTITLPASTTTLTGKGTPASGSTISTYAWTQTAGPVTGTIAAAGSASTSISGLTQAGTYTFRLTVKDDKGLTDTDDVTVTVNAAASQPPVADAGNNITVTLPATQATLSGKGTPASGSTISSYAWTQTAGPVTGTIAAAGSASTSISGLTQAGMYTFRLTVKDDKGLTDTDDVTVTVNAAASQPPAADAGANISITLPATQATLSGKGTPASGSTISSYAWTQTSGPVTGTITAPNSANTSISGLTEAGTYIFRLTVKDDKGLTDTDDMVVTVNSAASQPPVADAGNNITVTLPATQATLSGKGTPASGSTISTYAWTQTAGPVTGTIAAAGSASTSISGLTQAGTYTFRLTVKDDKGLTDTDDVTVTVNAAASQPPVADAGNNITVTLPATQATLSGKGTPASGSTISTYAWTQTSGPVTGTIAAPNSANTSISGLTQAGTYIFRLTVKDDKGLTDTDDMVVTVNAAASQPPVADAGNNIAITLPATQATLSGKGTPASGSTISSYAWTQTSGPVNGTIASPGSANTSISGLMQAGTYTFRLTVKDNKGLTDADDVTVTVNAAPSQPPAANAGGNITITQPASQATLTGSGTAASGSTIESYAWTQTSGPATANILSAGSASSGISQLTEAGQYTFRLTVTDDKGLKGTDDVTVTVQPAANQAPVADAGSDREIVLPVSTSSLDGSGSRDADGTIASYRWVQISGPVTATIVNNAGVTTNLQGLTARGTYVFELTVTDNDGATATDRVTVVVNPALPVYVTAHAGSDKVLVLPDSRVTLNGSTSTGTNTTITSYSWIIAEGNADGYLISGGNTATPVIDFTRRGRYVFRLTVKDAAGHESSDDVVVEVTDNDNDNHSEVTLNIYPNPVSTQLRVEINLPSPTFVTIQIFSIGGRKEMEISLGNIQNVQRFIDVSGLADGLYVLYVTDNKHFKEMKKFVKAN